MTTNLPTNEDEPVSLAVKITLGYDNFIVVPLEEGQKIIEVINNYPIFKKGYSAPTVKVPLEESNISFKIIDSIAFFTEITKENLLNTPDEDS